jgi:hypothetical protein
MYSDLHSRIVFGQNPHPVVTVTKDVSMGLLIKLLLLLYIRIVKILKFLLQGRLPM